MSFRILLLFVEEDEHDDDDGSGDDDAIAFSSQPLPLWDLHKSHHHTPGFPSILCHINNPYVQYELKNSRERETVGFFYSLLYSIRINM